MTNHPDPRAVSVELHGDVASVAAVRAWIEARGEAHSIAADEPDATVECRMVVVPRE